MRPLRSVLYYLLTGMAISALAFVNKYPLVYSDTGTYMANSFELTPNEDRPIGYGLIIRAVTWQDTMWTVVVFQGVVASWLLMLMVRTLVAEHDRWLKAHLLLITLLVLGSSLPWYSAQLMADHYTPLTLLIIFLLLRGAPKGKWRTGALWVLLFFFLATHNAHFPMAVALSGLLVLVALIRHRWRPGKVFWARWGALNITIIASILMVMLFNNDRYGRMQLSRASNVFMTGRLCQAGIMADYLKETCDREGHVFCKYKDHLPADAGDLLWSPEEMVNAEHLTIGQADSLLAPMVADLMGRPEYVFRYMRSVAMSTFVQLFQWEAGSGLGPYHDGSSPAFHIHWRLPSERYYYDNARQQWGQWDDRAASGRWQGILIALSLLVLALFWSSRASDASSQLRSLILWMTAWIFLNALITSAFSTIDPRLQSRVMWLLPMTAFFVMVQPGSWKALTEQLVRRSAA